MKITREGTYTGLKTKRPKSLEDPREKEKKIKDRETIRKKGKGEERQETDEEQVADLAWLLMGADCGGHVGVFASLVEDHRVSP